MTEQKELRKIDFTKIKVETEIGKFETNDISKALGNYIHQMTDDIGMDDIAHEIYYHGSATLDNEQIETIKGWIKQSNLAPFIKLAILRNINDDIQQNISKEEQ